MDITAVFEQAKKILLEDGGCRPLVLVETKTGEAAMLPIMMVDVWNGTTLDKEKMLFMMGHVYAGKMHVHPHDVESVHLITEMWFASEKAGDKRRPAERADRREALSVLELRIVERHLTQRMYMAEIIRHGDIVDLMPMQNDEVRSMLLLSFLAGIGHANMDENELAELKKQMH